MEQWLLNRRVPAYDLPGEFHQAARTEPFDFCLIDGPPKRVGRMGSLPLAANCLADGAVILVDDALRSGEQQAMREWRRHFGSRLARFTILLDRHGIAVSRWKAAE
jgi:predicted O-methyltransferase YrrM